VARAAATTQPTTIHHQRCAFAHREHPQARSSWRWRCGPRAQGCPSLRRRTAVRPQWSRGLLRMQGLCHSTGKHLPNCACYDATLPPSFASGHAVGRPADCAHCRRIACNRGMNVIASMECGSGTRRLVDWTHRDCDAPRLRHMCTQAVSAVTASRLSECTCCSRPSIGHPVACGHPLS
jgi:hypothetical protein